MTANIPLPNQLKRKNETRIRGVYRVSLIDLNSKEYRHHKKAPYSE